MKFYPRIFVAALWHSIVVHAESFANVCRKHILLPVVMSWKRRILV
jgi:hypothetical protein